MVSLFRIKIYIIIDTPDSTEEGRSASCVQVVRSGGGVGCRGCRWHEDGVRPFISLNPGVLVSVKR